MIARDGEGATRLIEVEVAGAKDDGEARTVARSIVSSNAFKAAVYGEDANWGRIICATGYSERHKSRYGGYLAGPAAGGAAGARCLSTRTWPGKTWLRRWSRSGCITREPAGHCLGMRPDLRLCKDKRQLPKLRIKKTPFVIISARPEAACHWCRRGAVMMREIKWFRLRKGSDHCGGTAVHKGILRPDRSGEVWRSGHGGSGTTGCSNAGPGAYEIRGYEPGGSSLWRGPEITGMLNRWGLKPGLSRGSGLPIRSDGSCGDGPGGQDQQADRGWHQPVRRQGHRSVRKGRG